MMNIYLSLPMTGKTREEIEKEISCYKAELAKERPTSVVISPLDVCSDESSYSKCMGLDIMTILESHAVCLCPGWENSRGCQLEYEAAKIYDKILMFL